ncbi:MAG TPA: hypothetical protein PKH77_05290 [Anaerolineae bacterium]|nr:hypothetical protein [Anaerolineae bacterium]
MKTRFTWLLVFALFALTLACGAPKETPIPPTNTPAPTATPKPTNTPAPTATPKPTNTPKVPTATPAPELDLESGWYQYTNGNYVRDIAVLEDVIVAATGGGVVIWNIDTEEIIAYDTRDGLPTNDTEAVAICPFAEKIYVGTDEGLAYLAPGEENAAWQVMTSENSGMHRDSVDYLACDTERELLFIGYTFGLDIYDFADDEWLYLDEDDGLITDWVDDAKFIGTDLWVVSSFGSSVIHADGTIEGFDEDLANIPDESVSAVAGDAAGNIWMAAFDGLLKYSGGKWTLYNSDNVENFPFLDAFESVIVADDGTLWIGNTFGDICRFDPVQETCVELYSDEDGMVGGLNAMVMDEKGYLFYADDGEGISGFDGKSWKSFILDEKPLSNHYEAITETPDGAIWLGGSFGLQIFSAYDADGEWKTNDMDGHSVSSFFHTEEGWWIAHSAGASYYSYADEEWTNYDYVEEPGEGIYNTGATVITVDGKGRVWFGNGYGLSVMDDDKFTYYDLLTDEERAEEDSPRTVYALLSDGKNVWVGTYDTLFRFDENDEMTMWTDDLPGITSLYSAGSSAMSLAQDGTPLLGVGRKLVRYDVKTEKFEEIYEADSEINTIFAAPDGTLWLGLYSSGVAFYEDNRWYTLTGAQGLPSNQFYGRQSVLVDSAGTAWFAASEGGLARYVP